MRSPASVQDLGARGDLADSCSRPKNPHVTVLMAVYNGMPYVRQAVASILKQSFTDFEFLVIDDASTDGTAACVRSFADPRLRLVRNEHNIGQAPSLNQGLALARGRFIARMDADDVCLPERLERQVALLQARPDLAVVGTWMYGVNAKGRANVLFGETLENFGAYVGLLTMGISPICHPSAMFRRDVIRELGGYDPSFAPAEDVNLWTRLALHRCHAAVIQEPLLLYRRHGGQLSAVKVTRQRGNVRRSQQRFLREFCPPMDVEAVSLLLARDPMFWEACPAQQQTVHTFYALQRMLSRMQQTFAMTAEETRSLFSAINRRLGPGVRLGRRISSWPSVCWYPAVWLFSPALAPIVGPSLSLLPWRVRQLKGILAGRRVAAIYQETDPYHSRDRGAPGQSRRAGAPARTLL